MQIHKNAKFSESPAIEGTLREGRRGRRVALALAAITIATTVATATGIGTASAASQKGNYCYDTAPSIWADIPGAQGCLNLKEASVDFVTFVPAAVDTAKDSYSARSTITTYQNGILSDGSRAWVPGPSKTITASAGFGTSNVGSDMTLWRISGATRMRVDVQVCTYDKPTDSKVRCGTRTWRKDFPKGRTTILHDASESPSDIPPTPPSQAPRATLEIAQREGNKIWVAGWAFDPDNSGASPQVHAYLNGVGFNLGNTKVDRPDVNKAFGIGGVHGFNTTIDSAAWGQLCFFAIDTNGTNNTALGCRNIAKYQPIQTADGPRGTLEIVARNGLQVRMVGTALDSDNWNTPTRIDVYLNGRRVRSLAVNKPRTEINKAFGINGNFGFDETMESNEGGELCFIAVDTNGSNDTSLGCRTIATY